MPEDHNLKVPSIDHMRRLDDQCRTFASPECIAQAHSVEFRYDLEGCARYRAFPIFFGEVFHATIMAKARRADGREKRIFNEKKSVAGQNPITRSNGGGRKMPWEEPKKLRDFLDRLGGLDRGAIPETPGVYVFSLGLWKRSPADLLYLGSGHNLLQRVGENVACALGFWSETVGRSQGGWKLSAEYCRQNGGRNPLDLYLGWLLLPKNVCPVPCERKLHARHYHKLSPLLLNKERVLPCAKRACGKHACADIVNSSSSCAHCYSF